MCRRSLLIAVAVAGLSVFAGIPGEAQELDKTLVIRKIAVLEPEDRTGGGIGPRMSELMADEIDFTLRFDRVPAGSLGLRSPATDPALKKAAEKFGIDAFIKSSAAPQGSGVVLNTVLSAGRTAETLARESVTLRDASAPNAVEAAVRQVVARLLGRIPFRALVTEVRGDAVTLDAGRVHGLEAGGLVKIIEITGSKRHPFTGEPIQYQTREVAEVVLSTVGDMTATGRTRTLAQAALVRPNQKAVFTPSQTVLDQSADRKQELVAWKKRVQETPNRVKTKPAEAAPERTRFAVEAGATAAINSYEFKSNGLNFDRKSNVYPAMEVRALFWPDSRFGIDASFKQMWIQYNTLDDQLIDVRAFPSWAASHLLYRYSGAGDELARQFIASAGVMQYRVAFSKRDEKYFNDFRYRGWDFGFQFIQPVNRVWGLDFRADYQPALSVKESPAESGELEKAYGYSAGLRAYFRLLQGLSLTAGYRYQAYLTDFKGSGTGGFRATLTDVSTKDYYHNLETSLRYEF